jgi:choice-of-anchor A domain-containing protein/uncharacterized repeat protein (TIGR02543 family)
MNTRRAYAVAAGIFLSVAAWCRGANVGTDVSTFATDVRNYNLITLGNASLTSSNDTQEGLAVEGNLILDGNTLMSGGGAGFVSSGDPGLYVGGHLTLNGGYSKMNGGYASTPGVGTGFTFSSKRLTAPSAYGSGILDSTNSSATNASTSPITNPVPTGWSWSGLTTSLSTLSSDLASAPATGTISATSNNLIFTPPSPTPTSGVVVFSLDCNLLGMGTYNGHSFSNVQINVPANVDYVINVINASGQTLFPCGTNFNSGSNNGQILWNIVGSGTVSLDGGQFFGAILAPGINLVTGSTIINGQVAAASFSDTGAELHFTTFQPAVVAAPPVINPPLTAAGKLNEAFSYTISATNTPTSFGASGLPAWLSLNSATGALGGTPTATGTFTPTITATNSGGTGTAVLTITVSQTYTLSIAGSPAAGGTFTGAGVFNPGTVVSIAETANSGYRANGWGGTDGASTAAPASASTTIVMSANRSLSAQFVQQGTVTVVAGAGGTATGSGTFDALSNAAITATPNAGYRFNGWTNNGVANLVASPASAVTTVQVPASALTVTAAFTTLTPPVFTSPNPLQVLVVGRAYSFTATATYAPTFSATGLPPGVTMATSGILSGTPTTVGSYTATLTATNSSGSATQSLPFIVYPVPVINPPLSVTGKLNEPFTYTITASGSPTSYNATGLPTWLSLNSTTGIVSGTPTATGTFTCTVLATNPGATGSATLTITVSQTYTLSISGSPSVGGSFSGSGVYDPGTVVSISESANSSYRTNGWGGTDGPATASPTSAATTMVMTANRSLVAQFMRQVPLVVTAGTGGTATGSGTFDVGAVAPLSATPSSGYRFVNWTTIANQQGPANSNAASTTLTMYAANNGTANFTALTPPVFTSPNGLQILVVGQPYTFTATATNAPSFSATGLPPGVAMATSGVISGTPTTLGSYTATLTATNSSGSATQSLPFIVYPVPVINPPLSVTGKLNEPFTYTITATGSPTSYGATGLPSWLSVNVSTGVMTGTPTATGTFTCSIFASNPAVSGSATLTITVSQTYTLTMTASPVNGGVYTGAGVYDPGSVVSITETPNGSFRTLGWGGPDGAATAAPASAATTIVMSANRSLVADFIAQDVLTVVAGAGGTATGGGIFDHGTLAPVVATPASGYRFAGWTGLRLADPTAAATTVSMTEPTTVTATFALLTPPVFTSPNGLQVLVLGQPYTFTATATNSPTFSGVSFPAGIAMASTGVISGTPTVLGSSTATLTATNSSGTATQNLPFIVYPVPVINPPLFVPGKLNEPFSYTISATGSPTGYGATGVPSWLTLDPVAGVLSGTPTAIGTFTCTISASNPGATGSATLTITVSQTFALSITGSPAAGGTFSAGGTYDSGALVPVTESANPGYRAAGWGGPDGAATASPSSASTTILMWSNRSLVAQFIQQGTLTVVAGTGGTATGGGNYDLNTNATIAATAAAGYRFTGWAGSGLTNASALSTTDDVTGNQTVTANFALLTPPVFTSPNNLQVLVVGQPYSFTATATYAPTFSASGLPLGISMDPSGVISGTPTTVGSWSATLTATNSSGSATQNLPFIVYPVPVINPPLAVTGKLNEAFTYTISASGSPTSFGAAGLPSWLTLDPTTGIITGTPTATGTFGCTLSASNPGATGSAQLTITISQTYTLAISGSPAAGGTFTGAGIYDPGTSVTITQTANAGYRTNGWGGPDGASAVAPGSPQTTIVMNGNYTLAAQFVQQATLTVVAGTGGTAMGSGVYDVGASVPISASPNGAYVFTGWIGDDVTNPNTAVTTVTLSGDETVTAGFFSPQTTPEQLGTINFPNAVASGQPGITPTTSTMPAVFVNNSDTPETVTALTTTGDFQPTVALPFTIAAGQSYSVTMTFAPTALGQRTGVLTAMCSDPTNPVAQFNLQGMGVNPNQPPSATLTAPATAFTGSPLTVMSTATAPMNNLTLHSVEWISSSGGWTVNVANVSGGSSFRTVGVTFPSTGVWMLRAGVSVDNGVTWYYSPSVQVTVSNGTTDYTLQTMAIPGASALNWYTPSPVVQQTYQVKHVNP